MTKRTARLFASLTLGSVVAGGVCVACGSFAADDSVSGADAAGAGQDGAVPADGALPDSSPDGAVGDGGPRSEAGACDLAAPWGLPAQIIQFGSTNPAVSLSEDELTAFFDTIVPNGGTGRYTIEIGTRSKVTELFTTGSEIAAPVQNADDTYLPALSPDGLTLFFTSNRAGNGYHLFFSTRTNVASAFGVPASASPLVGVGSEYDSFIDVGGDVWFASDRTGNFDIYRATRSGGVLGPPVPVMGLNTASQERTPVLSRDGLTLFFGSNRTGSANLDVWTATRASRIAPFGMPVRVSELSSSSNDSPRWLSPDGCRLYLGSDRSGSLRILVSSR